MVSCPFFFLEKDRKANIMPSASVSFLKTALQKMFVLMSPRVAQDCLTAVLPHHKDAVFSFPPRSALFRGKC